MAMGRTGFGYACIVTAVLIWAGWMAATRLAVTQEIEPLDLALLRYGVPALALAPWWLRRGLLPKGVPIVALLAMMGWGAPFVILMAYAMETASVAHTAAIVPCMMPLIAAALGYAVYGDRLGRSQRIGFAAIGIGAACVLLPLLAAGDATALGHIGLLMLCALGWASFTTAYRSSGLTALEAAGLVCVYSTLALAVAIPMVGSSLTGLDWELVAFHATTQGLLSGAVATIAYGLAIERLGRCRASSFSALVPGLAALIAYLWLRETPSALDIVALAFASLGVAFVNEVFLRRRTT